MPARTHRLAVDPTKPLAAEPRTGHNRWHEAIPPALEVEPGAPRSASTSVTPACSNRWQ